MNLKCSAVAINLNNVGKILEQNEAKTGENKIELNRCLIYHFLWYYFDFISEPFIRDSTICTL